MLLAAVLHATWQSLVKTGQDGLTVLTGMCLVSAAAAALALPFVGMLPPAAWLVLAVSMLFHSAYRVALARAYVHGDLSQAFSLARGFVPMFATGIAFATLRQVPTTGQLFGIAAISCGLLGLAFDSFLRGGIRGRLFVAAGAAGLMVAGYSVIDAYGTRVSGDWASYTAWLVALDSGSFFIVVRLIRGAQLWAALDRARGRTLMAGLLGIGSFAVFLWALSRSPVGAVSALRETSILFATLIGVFLHGDKRSPLGLAAVPTIIAGIGAIALAR
jgi:drug/metabolite transporter (DMT)-like permease